MSNVFSFVGTVGQDAQVTILASGTTVLNVSVANNIGFGDKQKTMWIRVALFGKRAEGSLKDYLKKGQQVFVSGELSTREWTDKDGNMMANFELMANVIDLVGGRRGSSGSNYGQQEQYPATTKIDYDYDIPF